MVQVQKVFNILSFFFFIPLVFIGAFFLLNLTLVVIKSKFTEEHEANKMRKKHSKFMVKKLTKKELKLQEEAKDVFKKAKYKNKKIRDLKIERKDSDDSRGERRHRRNLENLRHDNSFSKKFANPESRAVTAKSGFRANINMRPLHGISGANFTKKKANNLGEPITEEMSNSELSLMNQNNIFYPTNLSANGTADNPQNSHKNTLYLKKGKGKIRMEGMYGISKMNGGKNELGSNSDLLEDIPLSNEDDGEVENDTENEVVLRDSEIMLPLDSSISENSKPEKKYSAGNKTKGGKGSGEGESSDKPPF